MNTEVAMVGGAVKTKIDSERDRRPSRIFLATIEANLMLLGQRLLRIIGVVRKKGGGILLRIRTRLAGFVFSLSNSF